MMKHAAGPALAALAVCGILPVAATAGDLSRYRAFQLGSPLSVVAKQAGATEEHARTVHKRPALIQELEWSPQSVGRQSSPEAVRGGVLAFYDGALYRIVVDYDRYEIEGLTTADIVDAISLDYGVARTLDAPAKKQTGGYGDDEEVVARWEDEQHRFDLIRSPFGPEFRLVGVLKPLASQAARAAQEANQLDAVEAPQREVARIKSEEADARAASDKARRTNKPKFRP